MKRLTWDEQVNGLGWLAEPQLSRVSLRRPMAGDHAGLSAMLERCSLASRYGRVLGPLRRWPAGHLEAVTSTGADVEAWTAVLDGDGPILALASLHQQAPGAAEVALLVEDDWQRRGLGTRLLLLLAEGARARGITTLHAVVLSEHGHVLRLLQTVFGPCCLTQETGTTSVTIPLDHAGRPVQGAGVANTMTLER
jgi:GNAT superfamily N-acetyltransferase